MKIDQWQMPVLLKPSISLTDVNGESKSGE